MFRRYLLIINVFFLLTVFIAFGTSCTKIHIGPTSIDTTLPPPNLTGKPNIVFILADDVGFEIPTYSGGQSYSTPNLDALAAQGMQFSHTFSCPNCSPSRVEMLSGKYGFRNYLDWADYDTTQLTYVTALRNAGYATCVAGKWQFGGGDSSIRAMGFDKYLVHDPYTDEETKGGKTRYKSPLLYEAGRYLKSSRTHGKYADDMFADYITKFIDSNQNRPFFIYYPLNLVHVPFSPTPDDPEFADWRPEKNISNPIFFPSMVAYMDKKVGEIVAKLQTAGLSQNTYIIYSGDNGTSKYITSLWNGKSITGGKDQPIEYGVHVPLIVSCPSKITSGTVEPAIVDFSDFFKTFLDMAGVPPTAYANAGTLDSKSFYQYLTGSVPTELRLTSYCYWKPDSQIPVQNKHFVQNLNYKLYDSTNKNYFFNILNDTLELHPLVDAQLTPYEAQTKTQFQAIIASSHK